MCGRWAPAEGGEDRGEDRKRGRGRGGWRLRLSASPVPLHQAAGGRPIGTMGQYQAAAAMVPAALATKEKSEGEPLGPAPEGARGLN